MTPVQIYALLNAAKANTIGLSTLAVKDTTGFVSLGREVLSTQQNHDQFTNAICDVIGRTVVEAKVYNALYRNTESDTLTFGAALRTLKVVGVPNEENLTYGSTTVTPPNPQAIVDGYSNLAVSSNALTMPKAVPAVIQKIFSKKGTWQKSVVISRERLTSAFNSEADMASFLEAVFTEIQNDYSRDIETTVNLAIGTLMAMCINGTNAKRYVKLITEYNATVSAEEAIDTAEHAMKNPEFLKFASMRMNQIIKYVQKPSVMFNSKTLPTWSDKEDLVVEVLSDYAAATASYLEADTYHKDLVSLPNYNEITYWQGFGDGTFDDMSKIAVNYEDATGGHSTTKEGIIAVVRDKRAVRTLFDNYHTNSFFNPARDTQNYWFKSDKAYMVDDDYNCVVFTLE